MILCDLPYGTTQNKWDSVIPFEPLWAHYWRVLKKDGSVVLTAAQPFTSALVMSQPKAFKYQWVREKSAATGHLNARNQPMRNHEDVLVFYSERGTYNPQGLVPPRKGNQTRREWRKLWGIRKGEFPRVHELPPICHKDT